MWTWWLVQEFQPPEGTNCAVLFIGLTSMLILNSINSHLRDKFPQFSCIKAIDIYMVVCFFFVFLSLVEYVYINYLFYNRRGSRHSQRQLRRALRVMERYRYQEAEQVWLFEWQSTFLEHLLNLRLALEPFEFLSSFHLHTTHTHTHTHQIRQK